MKYSKIEMIKDWSDIVDYESDDQTVTLINSKGKKVAEVVYPEFTQETFNHYKKNYC